MCFFFALVSSLLPMIPEHIQIVVSFCILNRNAQRSEANPNVYCFPLKPTSLICLFMFCSRPIKQGNVVQPSNLHTMAMCKSNGGSYQWVCTLKRFIKMSHDRPTYRFFLYLCHNNNCFARPYKYFKYRHYNLLETD